jgi:hypothetical protein
MPMRVALQSLTFSDGTVLPVSPDGVVVLVGPNNAGKSVALREIHAATQSRSSEGGKVVTVSMTVEGSPEDFAAWLDAHTTSLRRPGDNQLVHRRMNWGLHHREHAIGDWHNYIHGHPTNQTSLAQLFCLLAAAQERLTLANGGVQPHDPLSDGPSNPMQTLMVDSDLEARVSQICLEAFDQPLTLSRVMGSPLFLHLGTAATAPSIVPTEGYIEELRGLPRLDEQGDGMKSFVGLMLAIVTSQFPIVLVDEPEAFLHPPQARMLGRRLASEPQEGTQVVVATHNVHVLQGLLDDPSQEITVARIVRDGSVNRLSILSPDDLRELWQDPLLKYSAVLEGLFHRGVVVSEADSDSRFYAAVLDEAGGDEVQRPHDLHFTQSGGKQRLHVVIAALRAVDVPVAAIADFDVLREQHDMEKIVEALGGAWSEVEPLWRPVKAALDQLGSAPPVLSVREAIQAILESESGTLSADGATKIRDAIRLDSARDIIKRGGASALPGGEASEKAKQLLARLEELRLFVVPVGEAERWVPEVGGHGPKWVSGVLTQRLHIGDVNGARDFMLRVQGSLA